jgi:hypothetical protein
VNYAYFDFVTKAPGARVVTELQGVESDVLLLDDVNYRAFKAGRGYKYAGGHYKKSPVRLAVPSAGSWHVVVIPLGGKVRAKFSVIP